MNIYGRTVADSLEMVTQAQKQTCKPNTYYMKRKTFQISIGNSFLPPIKTTYSIISNLSDGNILTALCYSPANRLKDRLKETAALCKTTR